MVLAPHPDDETLGCGAVIARARAAGDQVVVVVVTDGRHSTASTVMGPHLLARTRAAELRLACRILGVSDEQVVQLDREDGTLSGCVAELADELAALLVTRQPEAVFVPCAQDIHPDHQALHQALCLALRRTGSAGGPGGSSPVVLAYPVWTWMSGPWFLDADPARRLPLQAWAMRQLSAGGRWVAVRCGDHLRAKTAAIAAYASQTTNLTGERSWSYLSAEAVALFQQPSEVFLRFDAAERSSR